jgi:putative oxidoreductase
MPRAEQGRGIAWRIDVNTARRLDSRLIDRIGGFIAPAMVTGWIAFMSQPSPILGFAIAFAIELGGGLLRALTFRIRIAAFALAMFPLAAAVVFHFAAGDWKRPLHLPGKPAVAHRLETIRFGATKILVEIRHGFSRLAGDCVHGSAGVESEPSEPLRNFSGD